MSIFSKIRGQPKKVQKKKATRQTLFYRIYVYPETAEKIEELKEILKDGLNPYEGSKKQQAEIFRKLIGLAYYDIKNDIQSSNKIKKHRKVVIMKSNSRGRKKQKQIKKEIWLKGAV
ncbi:MAG: hypothetical protein PHF45_00830 [Candidatus Pacebacteria bacterium]|nr:hypothetical protein [Candidatus Paceibacterota bacterium]